MQISAHPCLNLEVFIAAGVVNRENLLFIFKNKTVHGVRRKLVVTKMDSFKHRGDECVKKRTIAVNIFNKDGELPQCQLFLLRCTRCKRAALSLNRSHLSLSNTEMVRFCNPIFRDVALKDLEEAINCVHSIGTVII
jgi:hypothetical protein